METKAPNPITHLQDKQSFPIIAAYFEFAHLKQLYRQGWLMHGIPPERCESVAEHSFGVALLALFLADAHFPVLDTGKVLRMALLHDIGEVYAGDIVPGAGVSAGEKHQLETESASRVLGRQPRGKEYLALWEEFEEGESPEAQFVRQIDTLEMALQASVYEHQKLADLGDFYKSAGKGLWSPELLAILRELKKLRSKPPADS
ncbi:MAG: HD domain-containing protein [Chloroflexota bacterium]